jgi:hypothetical protein
MASPSSSVLRTTAYGRSPLLGERRSPVSPFLLLGVVPARQTPHFHSPDSGAPNAEMDAAVGQDGRPVD